LKQSFVSPHTQIILADPPGSSLYHRVVSGVCYAPQQAERKLQRNRYDTIVEGVGLDRITANFECAVIDDAISVSDQEILEMAHWILRHEGLLIGSSSALNIAATCLYATAQQKSTSTSSSSSQGRKGRKGTRRKKYVTVICDSGTRHLSRFWNSEYVQEKYHLRWPAAAAEAEDSIPKCLLEYYKSNAKG
jgi:cysteine synthase